MQHSRPTLAFKPLIPLPPNLYLLPMHPHHRSDCPATPPASSFPPNFLRVLQWNAGGLRGRSTELLYFLLPHPIDLICIQEFNHNSSSSLQIPGYSALRSNRTHSRSGIFSPQMPCTLAAVSTFSSDRVYPSLNFLPPLFLHLTPTLIT